MRQLKTKFTQDSLLLDLRAKVVRLGGLGEYTRIDKSKVVALWVGLEDPNPGFIMGTGLQAIIRPLSAEIKPFINQVYGITYAADVTYTAHGVKFARDFLEKLTATFVVKDYQAVDITFQQGTDKTLAQYSVKVYV